LLVLPIGLAISLRDAHRSALVSAIEPSNAHSFDNLVGAAQQRQRNVQAERSGGYEIASYSKWSIESGV
jgi:hypothetical protein